MRWWLGVSLLLNAAALIMYITFSHGSVDVRQRAVKPELSPETAQELLRLLHSRTNQSAPELMAKGIMKASTAVPPLVEEEAPADGMKSGGRGEVGGTEESETAEAGAQDMEAESVGPVRGFAGWLFNSLTTLLLLLPAIFGSAALAAAHLQVQPTGRLPSPVKRNPKPPPRSPPPTPCSALPRCRSIDGVGHSSLRLPSALSSFPLRRQRVWWDRKGM